MITSAADVRIFLANELPCYTNDSAEDDFIFVATAEDIERVALKLWRSLRIGQVSHSSELPHGKPVV